MTTPDLIAELAEVVRLDGKATSGKWSVEAEGKNEFGQLEFTIEVYDGKCPIVGSGSFFGDPHDANLAAAAVNFLRTHHAEIEAMARDAERWRYVVTHAEWIMDEDDTLMAVRFAGVKVNLESVGMRTDAIDRAMHDSAREGGE